jgi:gamma-butyrobetaine dioxygenase
MNIVDEIIQLLESRGAEAYFGEPLSQLDHAVQAARLARASGAEDSLVVAALLHDVGHLVSPGNHFLFVEDDGFPSTPTEQHFDGSTPAHQQFDRRHEEIGAAWLARWFGPEVTEPIRLHVTAKRYICRVDSEYRRQLSAASIHSLVPQGGPLNQTEIAEFESNPYYRMAVQLRRWDDKAKIPNIVAGVVQQYRQALRSCLKLAISQSVPPAAP